MPQIAAPKGTRDILPDEFADRRWLLDAHAAVAESFGYRGIETPIIESTELFSRGVGTDTDIVEKQMFTFEDRGGRSLTLRPEGTAGTLRAVLGAHLDQELRPVRLQLRRAVLSCRASPGGTPAPVHPGRDRVHRRRLAGARRRDHRGGLALLQGARYRRASTSRSTHSAAPRTGSRYRAALVAYYTPLEASLCDDCRRSLHTNPLRLLDCKRDAGLVAAAPMLWDSLDRPSRDHFTAVLRDLEAAGIDAIRNDRLVRGLDYYSHTVFEFWHDILQGAQSSLGGGGRYDGLAELLGFPATPATGYALGVERILMVARALGDRSRRPPRQPTCSSARWNPGRPRRPPSMARLLRGCTGHAPCLTLPNAGLTASCAAPARRCSSCSHRWRERGGRVTAPWCATSTDAVSRPFRSTELADTVTRILGGTIREHSPHLLRHPARRRRRDSR